MAKMYYELDADMSFIKDKRIAIVGYGSQGHAHALNLKEKGVNTITQAYIIPIKNTDKCLKILQTLRKEGIKTDIDLIGRGISKNLDYANTLGFPYVIIAGIAIVNILFSQIPHQPCCNPPCHTRQGILEKLQRPVEFHLPSMLRMGWRLPCPSW